LGGKGHVIQDDVAAGQLRIFLLRVVPLQGKLGASLSKWQGDAHGLIAGGVPSQQLFTPQLRPAYAVVGQPQLEAANTTKVPLGVSLAGVEDELSSRRLVPLQQHNFCDGVFLVDEHGETLWAPAACCNLGHLLPQVW
jgi:hypothetical protein